VDEIRAKKRAFEAFVRFHEQPQYKGVYITKTDPKDLDPTQPARIQLKFDDRLTSADVNVEEVQGLWKCSLVHGHIPGGRELLYRVDVYPDSRIANESCT